MNIEELVRPNILTMQAYSSARDEYESDGSVSLLDANENPFETEFNRYPDPYQKELKAVIANLKGVKTEQLFLGNGSDEAIDLILRIFCEPGTDNILITDPTYGMYQVAAAIQNVEVRKIALTQEFDLDANAILSATDERSKVLFICNPNNPTGNLFNSDQIALLINRFQGIVVIDEAYIDFTTSSSSTKHLNEFDNLIVLQTFSKAWGLAGLRLGMAFSNAKMISLFNKVKAPYNLSSLTQKVAKKLIEANAVNTNENLQLILTERNRLASKLDGLNCVTKIFDSEANFLLIRFKDHNKAYKALTNAKLIVRDRSKALHCDNCLRITVGTKEENNNVISILENL